MFKIYIKITRLVIRTFVILHITVIILHHGLIQTYYHLLFRRSNILSAFPERNRMNVFSSTDAYMRYV